MGKKSSKAPDVTGAAVKEGEYSRDTSRDQIYANRPDQYNAFGSLTWEPQNIIDPATGKSTTKWVQRENMSSDLRNLYNSQMSQYNRNAQMAAAMGDRINAEVSAPVNWTQFGDVQALDYDPTELRQSAENAAYQRAVNRLDPQFEGDRQQMEIRLRNRGLQAGDQQYQSEMDSFMRGRNDAYEQARLGAVGEGRTEADMLWNQQVTGNQIANALRDKQIEEYIAKRQYSIGEQQALNPIGNISQLANVISGGGE